MPRKFYVCKNNKKSRAARAREKKKREKKEQSASINFLVDSDKIFNILIDAGGSNIESSKKDDIENHNKPEGISTITIKDEFMEKNISSPRLYSQENNNIDEENIEDEKEPEGFHTIYIEEVNSKENIEDENLKFETNVLPKSQNNEPEGYNTIFIKEEMNLPDEEIDENKVLEENPDPLQLNEVSMLQRRWKSTRSSYAREICIKKTQPSGSGACNRKTHTYFEQLGFLNTTSKKSSGRLEKDENAGDHPVDPDDSFESFKFEEIENKDEDRHFLLSLLSEMKKVPAENKLELKSRIILEIAHAQKPTSHIHPSQPQHLMDLTSSPAGLYQHYSNNNNHNFSSPIHILQSLN